MCNYHIIPFLYEYSVRFINNIIVIIVSMADQKYGESFYILAVKAAKAKSFRIVIVLNCFNNGRSAFYNQFQSFKAKRSC